MTSAPRVIGIDESGCLSDPELPMSVVVSLSSHNPADYKRTSSERVAKYNGKPRGRVKRHDSYQPPFGSFQYVALTPAHMRDAKLIYGEPETGEEISWNGKFYEFRLRHDAIIRLLEERNFDPNNEKVIIDAFCGPGVMLRQLSLAWQRQYGEPLARRSVECQTHADEHYPIINAADEDANRLMTRLRYPERFEGHDESWRAREITLSADDMMRLNLNRHMQREARRRMEHAGEDFSGAQPAFDAA